MSSPETGEMPIPPLDNWGSKLRAVPRQMEGGSSSTDPGQCDNEEDHPELEEEEEDVCGICRVPYDGCCPDCKLPGDDCPLSGSRTAFTSSRTSS